MGAKISEDFYVLSCYTKDGFLLESEEFIIQTFDGQVDTSQEMIDRIKQKYINKYSVSFRLIKGKVIEWEGLQSDV